MPPFPPPSRLVPVDDRCSAATACDLARSGVALLWRGDFPQARRLLAAMGRRLDRRTPHPVADPAEAFREHRRARRNRARVLGQLLVAVDAEHRLDVRRAPDVRKACRQAYGAATGPGVLALRELLGVLGAHQWRERGVFVPALGARVHPHYGVFTPTRSEYVDLVAQTPLPALTRTAFDLGTGTGVLAAVLARRGIARVTATDSNPRALACARDNATRLGLTARIQVPEPCLYPEGRADLVVCNPPWLPAHPVSDLEKGVYDPDSRMLRGFLTGLTAHLEPGGEGWLVLSDLAERVGLRTRAELVDLVSAAGLRVAGRIDTTPRHPKAAATEDPFHAARAGEVTSLWRLQARPLVR
ncbi:class I SAM-dependent methyltransferase [Amycolatopsis sp. NPDC051372]|uniref:class I SAM-dependent methyltransferase n=1 Tax=Amycolatopsis sp. NPDC051372 TaxID=3155669 RepID=UPI00343020DC